MRRYSYDIFDIERNGVVYIYEIVCNHHSCATKRLLKTIVHTSNVPTRKYIIIIIVRCDAFAIYCQIKRSMHDEKCANV